MDSINCRQEPPRPSSGNRTQSVAAAYETERSPAGIAGSERVRRTDRDQQNLRRAIDRLRISPHPISALCRIHQYPAATACRLRSATERISPQRDEGILNDRLPDRTGDSDPCQTAFCGDRCLRESGSSRLSPVFSSIHHENAHRLFRFAALRNHHAGLCSLLLTRSTGVPSGNGSKEQRRPPVNPR